MRGHASAGPSPAGCQPTVARARATAPTSIYGGRCTRKRTKRRLAPESIDAGKLAEVINELGYRIDRGDQPAPALVNHFTTLIPAAAPALAAKWRALGCTLLPLYESLRRDDLTLAQRGELRRELLKSAGVTDHGTFDDDWFDG